MKKNIFVKGAPTHNLKNINVEIPRNKLVTITGLSGSGKSSLAFDTIFAEGQRRYMESLSSYARQFLSIMDKPDVDVIEGLSPAISIEQKSSSHKPRSTVGTVTEIYDYLRLLYARVGTPRCPEHSDNFLMRLILIFSPTFKFSLVKISKAIVKREFPASTAVDSPNLMCVDGFPLLKLSLSIHGKSSWIRE